MRSIVLRLSTSVSIPWLWQKGVFPQEILQKLAALEGFLETRDFQVLLIVYGRESFYKRTMSKWDVYVCNSSCYIAILSNWVRGGGGGSCKLGSSIFWKHTYKVLPLRSRFG
jgi:hypothetical protein